MHYWGKQWKSEAKNENMNSLDVNKYLKLRFTNNPNKSNIKSKENIR
jgi:hypothetical protein